MSTLDLIDSHAHLDVSAFESDLDDVINRAREAGVRRILTIGAGGGPNSAERAVALAHRYPNIWASVGIHPHDADQAFDLDRLRALAGDDRVVAIGETGLDFYRRWSDFDNQRRCFIQQISLAKEVGKPLIIHSRDAGEECFEILVKQKAEEVGGVFHCFSESAEFASRLLEINFMVSFPGTITFKKAFQLREVVRQIPLTQILVETDAPYMAPEPHRGKRCESSWVKLTADKLAEIKKIPLEECARILTENTKRLFKPMQRSV